MSVAEMKLAAMNHLFVDGNKRTGYLTLFTLLKFGDFKLTATEKKAYDFTIKVSTGE